MCDRSVDRAAGIYNYLGRRSLSNAERVAANARREVTVSSAIRYALLTRSFIRLVSTNRDVPRERSLIA